jgi:hypothetical protein
MKESGVCLKKNGKAGWMEKRQKREVKQTMMSKTSSLPFTAGRSGGQAR